MSNTITICNRALLHLGAKTITSLNENSKEARVCNLVYDGLRDEVLESHDWSFARKRVTLALSSETSDEYSYVYLFPSDAVAARYIWNGVGLTEGYIYNPEEIQLAIGQKVEYEIVSSTTGNQRLILTNIANAVLVYTARITDANMYSPQFPGALALRLAADLSQPIKGDANLSLSMFQRYTLAINQARAVNSNEENRRLVESNPLVDVRL